jgi:hypothetical protein
MAARGCLRDGATSEHSVQFFFIYGSLCSSGLRAGAEWREGAQPIRSAPVLELPWRTALTGDGRSFSSGSGVRVTDELPTIRPEPQRRGQWSEFP